MDYKELYIYLKNKKDYTTIGNDVQFDVYADRDKKIMFLFFQESASHTDWKTNLDFPCKVYKQQQNTMYVHRGYVDSWKSCNDAIMSRYIEAVYQSGYEPYIVGWSYGGAMSLLAGEDFYFRTGRRAQVITYGAPKILYYNSTKKTFKNSMHIKQFRSVNDFVTWCIPLLFVHHLDKQPLNEKFSLKKLIHTEYSHTHYEEVII